jgi:hypothetical protein
MYAGLPMPSSAGPAAVTATAQSAVTEAAAGQRTQAGAVEYAQVHVWANGVNVRNGGSGTAFEQCKNFPSRLNCQVVATVSQGTVTAYCQQPGELITDSGYSSRWWTYLKSPSEQWGWVNNVYITGDEHLANVRDCEF